MNLPNKLTVLRVLMIPLFLLFFFLAFHGYFEYGFAVAFAVFVLASLTDLLDGKIARARGLVTDFGKLMDPLADKLLVMSAMVCFIAVGYVHPVVVIIILAREFLVTSIRLLAASSGQVLAADIWGKAKTVFQMVWLCYGLLVMSLPYPGEGVVQVLYWVHEGLVIVVTALTLISGFNYVRKNRALFADM